MRSDPSFQLLEPVSTVPGPLRFRVVPESGGDELQIRVDAGTFAWRLPAGMPLFDGQVAAAVELPTVRGKGGLEAVSLDAGFCGVGPLDLDPKIHFHASYDAGLLELTLCGGRLSGTFRLLRTTGLGSGSGWSIQRMPRSQRLAS